MGFREIAREGTKGTQRRARFRKRALQNRRSGGRALQVVEVVEIVGGGTNDRARA